VFGLSASMAERGPEGIGSSLLVLLAITLVCLVVQPWASAAALRAYLK
jgi:hypothetical protein